MGGGTILNKIANLLLIEVLLILPAVPVVLPANADISKLPFPAKKSLFLPVISRYTGPPIYRALLAVVLPASIPTKTSPV